MPRAIVFQIIVLATLTSCAAISGLADKEAVATHVIRNDGDRAELERRTLEVWDALVSS